MISSRSAAQAYAKVSGPALSRVPQISSKSKLSVKIPRFNSAASQGPAAELVKDGECQ